MQALYSALKGKPIGCTVSFYLSAHPTLCPLLAAVAVTAAALLQQKQQW